MMKANNTSTVDLMLLGLLCEKPMNAYELQKQVKYRHFDQWIRISSPSVYKKVIRLKQSGYLESTPMRAGNMPEKTVYTITEAGKVHFLHLMRSAASSPVRMVFDFNAVIANLFKVPKKEALSLVENIAAEILAQKEKIEVRLPSRSHIPFEGQAVLIQQHKVICALEEFITEFKTELLSRSDE